MEENDFHFIRLNNHLPNPLFIRLIPNAVGCCHSSDAFYRVIVPVIDYSGREEVKENNRGYQKGNRRVAVISRDVSAQNLVFKSL